MDINTQKQAMQTILDKFAAELKDTDAKIDELIRELDQAKTEQEIKAIEEKIKNL